MTSKRKVAIITGASRGIGAALAERFRDLDYGVVATSRSIMKTEPISDDATLTIEGDIGEPDTAARVVDAAMERFGRIDLLINNAGIFIPKPFVDYSLRHSRADTTLLTNVFTGRPARVVSNRLTAEVGPVLDELPDFPLAAGAVAPLRAAAERRGAVDFTPLWSGQAAPLGRAIPARALTVTLAQEALERFSDLARPTQAATRLPLPTLRN
jgi:NAD(P)-dependent dehydrogenase (short-subunit alcohol dehydrogenase family)